MLKTLKVNYDKLGTNFKKQISNMSWLFFEQFISLVIGLFVGIWVARYLGPDRYGQYNYALSLVALFMPLVQLGLNGIVVREIVFQKDANSRDEILGTTFVIRLVTGTTAVFLSVGTVIYLRPGDTLSHWLVGIIAAGNILLAFDTIDLWFQSQVKSKYTVISRTTDSLVFSIVKVLLIQLRASLIAFAVATAAKGTIKIIGLSICYRIDGLSLRNWSVNLSRAKFLLWESWPLFFSGLAIMIQAYIDQVMLGQMIGDAEVGQYSAAMQLIAVFGFIPMVVCQSLAPAVTEAKIASNSLYFNRLENIYRLMFILFLLVSIPIFLWSSKIVIILFGQEYKEAGTLLSLFAVRLFFTNFGVAKSLFITNESLFKYSMLTAIIGSLVNVILNYVLIPHYAAVGALWATIASFATTVFLIDLLYPRMYGNLILMGKAALYPWRLKF
ncbi:flippase [Microcystis aeruginosa]|nr:flippase [Microcystis aeruginosa]